MAQILISEVIDRAKVTAQDVDFIQWPESEWLSWFNECMLALSAARTDAGADYRTVTIKAGSKQDLPDDANKLIEVVRNTSSGHAIRPIDRKILDEQHLDWHKTTGTEPRYYAYDERTPKVFWVYPSVSGGDHQLDIVVAKSPKKATSKTEKIEVEDWFAPAIVDYLLYRAYLKHAEYTNDLGRSDYFRRSFYDKIGVKTEAIDTKGNM
ncbi:hypothetical protein HPC37_02815 [Pasteurellaceae bacterium 20609_3]|uniref:phage adaptor protein n=1 Tax=Spirabiliibacterium mucosae TaxID=28156 RepID=UPI001AAD3A73|nr:DUF6682 family protein [Spirabiliibacterium mucosae]MBE2897786.1 hypothetical protein [Spirabiliibacterium mucosae]